jgi:hypothetical protein
LIVPSAPRAAEADAQRLLRALPLPLTVAAGLGAYGLISSAGTLGAVLFVAIVLLAGPLVLSARGPTRPR